MSSNLFQVTVFAKQWSQICFSLLAQEMEAHEHYDALDENQRLAMEAESRRLALLEQEAKTAAKHVHNIEKTQEEMFGVYPFSLTSQDLGFDGKRFMLVWAVCHFWQQVSRDGKSRKRRNLWKGNRDSSFRFLMAWCPGCHPPPPPPPPAIHSGSKIFWTVFRPSVTNHVCVIVVVGEDPPPTSWPPWAECDEAAWPYGVMSVSSLLWRNPPGWLTPPTTPLAWWMVGALGIYADEAYLSRKRVTSWLWLDWRSERGGGDKHGRGASASKGRTLPGSLIPWVTHWGDLLCTRSLYWFWQTWGAISGVGETPQGAMRRRCLRKAPQEFLGEGSDAIYQSAILTLQIHSIPSFLKHPCQQPQWPVNDLLGTSAWQVSWSTVFRPSGQ